MATKTAEDPKAKAPDIGDDEPQMAAKEAIGVTDSDVEHADELRMAAEAQLARLGRKSATFADRLDRRHAVRDGQDAVDAQADVRKSEAQRLEDQTKAFDAAQERAKEWIAPEPVKGRTTKVQIVLHPDDVTHRRFTIHIRALGEISEGFIIVFEDPHDPTDLKMGRIAESERFGTKNRVRVAEFDDKGNPKGEITHLGYKDFGPLRLPKGKYKAVVALTDDTVLAEEGFEILGDVPKDGYDAMGVPDTDDGGVGESEAERAAMGEQALARTTAKLAGADDIPDAPSSGKAKLNKDEKAARADSPDAVGG